MQKYFRFNAPPAILVGACGHGLSVLRALREGSVPTLVLEANLSLPGVRTCLAHIEPVNDINGPGLIDALLKLRPRIDAPGDPVLFLTNDTMVRTVAAHWEKLQPHYRLSWAHCREHVVRLAEKRHLESHCLEQGSAYPPSFLLQSAGDIDAAMQATGGPCIVKPTQPLAAFKTALPQDRADFVRLIEQFGAYLPFLVQRFIPGDDTAIYFCALYLDHGRVLARFDGHKLRSRPMGHTTVAEASVQADVFEETQRFFDGLGLSGPVSLELKRDAGGKLWVIEPTIGRTDFWVGLCTANGVNLPLAEYRSQTGQAQQAQQQRDAAVWFNEERDPFGRLWLARQPQLSLRWRRPVFLYLHRDDPSPGYLALRRIGANLAAAVPRRLSKLLRSTPA